MKNLIKRLISWAFFKYVYEDWGHEIKEDEPFIVQGFNIEDGQIEKDFEIVFEPDCDFMDAMSYSLGGAWDLVRKKFDNEIDQAMYEKKFHTIH